MAAWEETKTYYHLACLTTTGGEPQSRKQAIESGNWLGPDGWYATELAEMEQLENMGVFRWVKMTEVPNGTKLLGNKFVYKDKCPMPGVPGRKRARCVGKGFQECMAEYGESWAPVCRHETARAFFAAAMYHKHALRSIDIKSAFLTAKLDRDVYMRAPEGHEREGYCVQLEKAIYGLCDAPRAYYKSFALFLRGHDLHPTYSDPCLYKSTNPKYPSIKILEYVDDLQVSGVEHEIDAFVADLKVKYEIRDYGAPQSFIGMEVTRINNKLTLTQTKYIEQMAARFKLTDANYVSTPMEPNLNLTTFDDSATKPDSSEFRAMIGSLMYAQCLTQPMLSFSIAQLSRHLSRPTHAHMAAARRAIVWAYHHRHLGITYDGDADCTLAGWSDANYAACPDTRRSTGGQVFMWLGGAIAWGSKMQRTTATSTAESEYMAVSDCAHNAKWLRGLVASLLDADVHAAAPTQIFEDNRAAQKWCYNPVHHAKQKHIDVSYHFVREQCVEFKTLEVIPIETDKMLADVCTKSLPQTAFEKFMRVIMNLSDRSLRAKTSTPRPESQTRPTRVASAS